ncbi:MAG: hypothetical protein DCO96_11220 [Fluviicola sp. XM-24bin1]|nr:MAG: hypothetical protein DCO96_11220 [Fluviicola sp. XM-24bin1]
MKMLFAISLLLLTSPTFAKVPDSVEVIHWADVSDSTDREQVVALSFHKLKLEELPAELAEFKNIQYLILAKNRLSDLPDFIGEMKGLIYLDLSQNKFKTLPDEVCQLTSLQKLILNRNDLQTLPACISGASSLTYIDLWDNPIRTLPESLISLENLKKIDLSGIKFSPSFQEDWYAKLPKVKFIFEEPCNCME